MPLEIATGKFLTTFMLSIIWLLQVVVEVQVVAEVVAESQVLGVRFKQEIQIVKEMETQLLYL
jgi:hypothetical protein